MASEDGSFADGLGRRGLPKFSEILRRPREAEVRMFIDVFN